MTGLYAVRSEAVAVEELKPGDQLVLPNGRPVTVERVDFYEDDETFVVRWWRSAERGEPGYPRRGMSIVVGDEYNGRFYGSLVPVKAGERWTVQRG